MLVCVLKYYIIVVFAGVRPKVKRIWQTTIHQWVEEQTKVLSGLKSQNSFPRVQMQYGTLIMGRQA